MKNKKQKHDQTSNYPYGSLSSVPEPHTKTSTSSNSKTNTNKWATNDELWNGQTQIEETIIKNSEQRKDDHNCTNIQTRKKINLSGLVDRMLMSNRNEFESKIMEDWIKGMGGSH